MAGIGMRGSEGLALTGVGGIALVGNALARFTDFRASLTGAFHKGPGGIPWGDVVLPYVASLATGCSDYEALRPWAGKAWVAKALRVGRVASPETLRQHLDNLADAYLGEALGLVTQATLDLLQRSHVPLTPCATGHLCMDLDTTPHNNGRTRKEGVSRTYMKDVFGFAPIYAMVGAEGWCLHAEFRPGSQHGQKGTPDFLRQAIANTRKVSGARLLLRMDSAFDAAENYALAEVEGVDFLVKGNPAHLRWDWPTAAGALPRAAWRRSGRNAKVAYLARWEVRGFEGQPVLVRRLLKVTKRLRWDLGDVPPGQRLLIKKDVVMTAETWLTSLDTDPAGVIDLYADHATAEQFHSEIKGELDLERLPSGSFKTNSLVLHLGLLAYNLLRLLGILGKGAMRHRSPAKRHRMKTIIQELIRVPARILTGSDQLKLDLGRLLPGREAYLALHYQLASPLPRAA